MPTIAVVAWYTSPKGHCSQARTVSCTVNLVDNLSTLPNISWIGPDGCRLPDINTNNSRLTNPLEKQLLLNGMILKNKGVYKCLVSISIPESFIEGHIEETSVTTDTSCKLLLYGICNHQTVIVFSVPSAVEDLHCVDSLSPSNLLISWREPLEYGDDVMGYSVNVRGLRYRHGTREVIEYEVTDFNLPTQNLRTFISEGLGKGRHSSIITYSCVLNSYCSC